LRDTPEVLVALQVKEHGLQDTVMTLDELTQGEDTKNAGAALASTAVLCHKGLTTQLARFCIARCLTAFHGIHVDALARALRQLEVDGHAKCGHFARACMALPPRSRLPLLRRAGCSKATPLMTRA
jgi:hypothetical protein